MIRFISKYNNIKKLISYFALVIFITLVINNSLFIHRHITPDGQIIIHSHIFSENPKTTTETKHYHSIFEFLAIRLINVAFTSLFCIYIFYRILFLKHDYLILQHIFSPVGIQSLQKLRAPPISII